jgi:hypothetical protein
MILEIGWDEKKKEIATQSAKFFSHIFAHLTLMGSWVFTELMLNGSLMQCHAISGFAISTCSGG